MNEQSNQSMQGEPMSENEQAGKVEFVRQLFQRASDEIYRETGIRASIIVNDLVEPPALAEFFDDPPPRREPRFNIGDVVCLNSGGTAMNVSNTHTVSPVVECIWTDRDGMFCQEIIPESCLCIFSEGSN